MAWYVEWFLFTAIASATLYMGYVRQVGGEKLTYYGFSVIFWMASMYMWIVDHSGQATQILVLALIAPFLASLVWAVQSFGKVLDQPEKRDPFHD